MARALFHHGCGCGCGGHAGPAAEPTRDWNEASDEAIVCHCAGVTKKAVVEAIDLGAYTLPLVRTLTGAGRIRKCEERSPSGSSCEADLAALLELYSGPSRRRLG